MMQKVGDLGRLEQTALLEDAAGMFETNMNMLDMMRIALSAIEVLGTIDEYRAPADGMFTVQQDPWIMFVDWDAQLADLTNLSGEVPNE